MLRPTKHENLATNTLVVGADALQFLQGKTISNVEDLFVHLKRTKKIALDEYYTTLTFLWLAGLIDVQDHHIKPRS